MMEIPEGIKLKSVTFKSRSPFFEHEISDMKNNTVRRVTRDDPRYKTIKAWADGKEKLGFIGIQHTESDKKFIRLLCNVVEFEDLFILSWFPDCEHDFVLIDKWQDAHAVHYEYHCRYCLIMTCRSRPNVHDASSGHD